MGTATVAGNATYNPSAGYTPTGAGDYWWYASYGGDTNNNTATSTCGSTMSETDGGQVLPDGHGRRPGDRHRRDGHSGELHQLGSCRGHHRAPAVSGTITITVFGPQATRPDHLHHRGHDGGHGTRSPGNATYNPSAGYTPTAIGDYWWYASYGGDANNTTATSTCGSTMSETDGGPGRPDGDGDRPGDRHRRDGHHDGATSPRRSRRPRARTPPAPSPSRSSGPRPRAPTTCTTGGTTVGTGPRSAGNATYHPSAGYTPGAVGDYWWYASYGGDANNNTATSTCGSTMSETMVGQGRPDGHGDRPGDRHRRHGHRGELHQLGARGRHHRPGGDRHHHHHRLRPPGHGPDHLHHRGHDGGHGATVGGQRHLSPVGRLHADGAR